jgi:hypothetical protein
MDFERVAYYSQQEVLLERAKKTAEPIKKTETVNNYERMVEIAKRITSLNGCSFWTDKDAPNPFNFSAHTSAFKWEHVFEPDETHERPLQLELFAEYRHPDEASIPELIRVGAAWFDNLHTDDMTRKPISEEIVYVKQSAATPEMEAIHAAMQLEELDSPGMLRRLGLLEESLVEAEKVESIS